jgi:predicted RNase H-like nuclease (RuvC/YqgF family)
MTKRNENRTNDLPVFLDRDDVDNAILDYIHKHCPETKGLDITEWKFSRGEVNVSFDLDTYEKLGRVSTREHDELIYENEDLQSQLDALDDDCAELEAENDGLKSEVEELNECVQQLEDEATETIDEYEALITKLEKQLEDALNTVDQRDEQLAAVQVAGRGSRRPSYCR